MKRPDKLVRIRLKTRVCKFSIPRHPDPFDIDFDKIYDRASANATIEFMALYERDDAIGTCGIDAPTSLELFTQVVDLCVG